MRTCLVVSMLVLVGCAHAPVAPDAAARVYALPGASGEVTFDYLYFDRDSNRLFLPGGNTGNVYVFDPKSDQVLPVGGFTVVEREGKRGKRLLGPSSAAQDGKTLFVGNRGSSEVCTIDTETLARGSCVALPTPPDGLAYVATTHEVWATTPKSTSITVLDASDPAKLSVKANVVLPGEPEGYFVDADRGLFFTNLEDKDRTLTIDVRTKTVVADFPAGCGESGPRGIAVDVARQLAMVACTNNIGVLDLVHGGAALSRTPAGEGIDNIDYLEAGHRLFVAAGKDARLTELDVGDASAVRTLRTTPTVQGAKCVVVDSTGRAFVTDPHAGTLLVVSPN